MECQYSSRKSNIDKHQPINIKTRQLFLNKVKKNDKVHSYRNNINPAMQRQPRYF
jgi:hypothetical protein